MGKILHILNSLFEFMLLFGTVIIITGLWAGVVFLFSPLVLLLSFILALILHKKFPSSFQVPAIVWGIAAIVLILVLIPVISSNGVAASADAISTTAIRVLDDKIPLTYSPYSNVSFTYQLGFPILAQTFSDIFYFIPDFWWGWILAAFFAAALIPIVFETAREWISYKAALIAAALAIAGKLVFQNFYWGEFAWVCATVYLLATFLYLKKSHPFAILCAAAVAALHPAIFFNLLLLLVLFYLYMQKIYKPQWLLFAILLAIPAIYFNYLPIAINIFGGSGESIGFYPQRAIQALQISPFWIGTGLTMIFAASIAAVFLEKKLLEKKWLALWVASCIIFLLLYTSGTVLANREIELVLLSTIFFAAANWSKTDFFSKHKKHILACFLIIGLFSFYSSSTLEHLRSGSKISQGEIEFSYKFRELDKTEQKTIFLTHGSGKFVEITNKIPFDANADYLISTAEVLIVRNKAWGEFMERHKYQEHIIKTRCAECITNLSDFKYAVIDSNYAQIELDRPILLEHASIKLYLLNG